MKSEKPTPPAIDERAEFEKAYRAYCGWGNFDKRLNGEYLAGERLENSWAIWQAARADRAELRTALTVAKEALEQVILCQTEDDNGCDLCVKNSRAALAKIREVMP